jgi:uncharacterized protein (TIGR02996 family)
MKADLGVVNQDEAILFEELLHGDDQAAARLVYRDWLEEQGDERAEVLRLEAAIAATASDDAELPALRKDLRRLRALLRGRWRTWLMQVSQATVENCTGPPRRRRNKQNAVTEDAVEFAFVCPKTWDGLQSTHDNSVRYCDVCQQHVFFCETVQAANDLAVIGHCIAIDASQTRHAGDFRHGAAFLGMVSVPRRIQKFYEQAKNTRATVREPRRKRGK